jgi:hypothetical protein
MMSGRGGKRAGAGRPKGRLGNETGDIKAMVVGALQAVGGVEYLAARALDQPVAFMGLVGRVLPLQVSGDPNGAPIMIITGVIRDMDAIEMNETEPLQIGVYTKTSGSAD